MQHATLLTIHTRYDMIALFEFINHIHITTYGMASIPESQRLFSWNQLSQHLCVDLLFPFPIPILSLPYFHVNLSSTRYKHGKDFE